MFSGAGQEICPEDCLPPTARAAQQEMPLQKLKEGSCMSPAGEELANGCKVFSLPHDQ